MVLLINIFTRKTFNIYLKVTDSKDQKIHWQFSLNVSEQGYRAIKDFFTLIMGEVLKDHHANNDSDDFSNISRVIFRRFNMSSLNECDSLEEVIKRYIQNLKEYTFFLPTGLTEYNENKTVKSEIDRDYYDLSVLVEIFKNTMRSLRDEKIEFWNRIFQLYQKDKEAYDLDFRTKHLRREKDLDRASKITPEDAKDLL